MDVVTVQLLVYRGSQCSSTPNRDAVHHTSDSTKYHHGSRIPRIS